MSKKRMIIFTSVILSVVVISLGIVKLYQTYAIGNYIDTASSATFDVNITRDTSVRIPANGYSNVFYMVTNTSPGTVRYGVAYTTDSAVTVKTFSTSKDSASGMIEENEKKYVKLRLENTSSTVKNITLSTVLGYENGGDLVVPSGVTLVTDTYTPPLAAAEYITKLYTDASKTSATNNGITYNYANIYDTDSDNNTSGGLMNDRLGGTTTDLDGGNIRYYGASPNNYIYFNCSDYSNQTSSTCETWRIIGVFDGKLKLIRNESIGNLSWDYDKNDDSTKTTYDNDWSTATLQKLLNGSYYNGSGIVTYYLGGSGPRTASLNMTSIGIKNETTRNMIVETTYNLGGWNSSSVYPNQIYGYERGTTVYTGRPPTWTGKIALAYPSDYGYAADFSQCNQTLNKYNDSTCTSNNWMKAILGTSSLGWLLTPYSDGADRAWLMYLGGYVYAGTNNDFRVVPVLSLSSELEIESWSGDGSSSNPYKLSA